MFMIGLKRETACDCWAHQTAQAAAVVRFTGFMKVMGPAPGHVPVGNPQKGCEKINITNSWIQAQVKVNYM